MMSHDDRERMQKETTTDDEPTQHSSSSLIARFCICNSSKEIRPLAPIGYEIE